MFLQPLRGDKGREFAANAAENGGKVPVWLEATGPPHCAAEPFPSLSRRTGLSRFYVKCH